jgi:hypothetical protein
MVRIGRDIIKMVWQHVQKNKLYHMHRNIFKNCKDKNKSLQQNQNIVLGQGQKINII